MALTNRYQKFIIILITFATAQNTHEYLDDDKRLDIQLIPHDNKYTDDAIKLMSANKKQYEQNEILNDIYTTIVKNIKENSRELELEDFSWHIFNGAAGHLEGFNDLHLVSNISNIITIEQIKTLNISLEFLLTSLKATWQHSVCFGNNCVITMEMKNASFALRMLFNVNDCVVDHSAYLKSYKDAKFYTSHPTVSTFSTKVIQTTAKLLSQLMNTPPFRKIIGNNVDYALLKLPVFSSGDIVRICNASREI